MRINSVSVNINADYSTRSNEDKTPVFTLSASVSSDDRGFLERVAAAVHRELAHPQPSDPIKAAVIAAGGVV